jgi:hypothetical protein
MPLAGFEPTTPASEWANTFRGLDRAAIVISSADNNNVE